jgi:OOP family OmpA-OmpF porin
MGTVVNFKKSARLIAGALLLSLVLMQTACTAPRPAAPPPGIAPADSDQDGVLDYLDFCPGTAAGIAVDEKGCPVVTDKDRDGVPDALDACPNTPAGTAVDARGCPVVLLAEPAAVPVLTLLLEYLPDSSAVSDDFAAELKQAADFVAAYPGRRFIIEGHTDSIGNAAVNLQLSRQRAEKVKAYLVEQTGISPALLEARGFGESNPVADNSSQEGRRQNRRIVMIALPQ